MADKAYSSRRCYELATELQAIAFILFKKNATGKSFGSSTWSKMYSYFMLHREEFMKHYHQRSNIESTFSMIKKKFGPYVRSRDITAQKNEVLLKILCHNICVVNQEMHELGIQADFKTHE
ncbi:putative transposase, IS4 family protein [Candidatus Nitrososphaera gargensis Ga9.2]|uniref:Putative transposase, IS4 family protein n=1 Tax=Nitrososphaera gargensis (strain Ga9.2) TaxID=1237085 RepID=K0IH55_NITGG|nr:transposase [Candidatus Nitrososphaera gargensis]AFU59205.1 putative transposase, IS4 family protein [Candidatus Nitrososphaera gargensis Ga9.2]